MKYIDIQWLHDLDDEPYRLVSEIDINSFEIRKLEFFSDGVVGYASEIFNTEKTMLGLIEVPSLDQINLDDEFQGKQISKISFERLWSKYVAIDL